MSWLGSGSPAFGGVTTGTSSANILQHKAQTPSTTTTPKYDLRSGSFGMIGQQRQLRLLRLVIDLAGRRVVILSSQL